MLDVPKQKHKQLLMMSFFRKHQNKISHSLLVLIILVFAGLWIYNIKTEIKTPVKTQVNKEIVKPTTEKKDTTVITAKEDSANLDFWGIVITATLGLVGTGLNYTQRNRFSKIDDLMEKNNEEHYKIIKENSNNYEMIVTELRMLKDINNRRRVVDSLREIINSYTRMTSDVALKPFIDAEGERIITFAEEIMNEHFTKKVQEQAIVKIDYTQDEQKEEAHHLFGKVFGDSYDEIQTKNINNLKESILKIASDELLNHKYERFKSVCESFLHTHLIDVIKLHLTLGIK